MVAPSISTPAAVSFDIETDDQVRTLDCLPLLLAQYEAASQSISAACGGSQPVHQCCVWGLPVSPSVRVWGLPVSPSVLRVGAASQSISAACGGCQSVHQCCVWGLPVSPSVLRGGAASQSISAACGGCQSVHQCCVWGLPVSPSVLRGGAARQIYLRSRRPCEHPDQAKSMSRTLLWRSVRQSSGPRPSSRTRRGL